MFPPKKILFPVDFSERCASVAPMAETFTRRFQSELTLLHVLPPEALDVPFTPAQAALETFAAHKLAGIETKQVLLHGDPAGEIVRFAQEQNSNLIMMPTHGYGPFRRFLFGSVTAKVLHDARPPVWTDVHAEEIVSYRDRSHPRTEASDGCVAHWRKGKHARSADRMQAGRAPARAGLQNPCACPSLRRQDRSALRAPRRTSGLLQHSHQLPQRDGVETPRHFNPPTAGEKHR